jgi:hypothetical protein
MPLVNLFRWRATTDAVTRRGALAREVAGHAVALWSCPLRQAGRYVLDETEAAFGPARPGPCPVDAWATGTAC